MNKINKIFFFLILLLLDRQKAVSNLFDSVFDFFNNTKEAYHSIKETYNELYYKARYNYKEALEDLRIEKENAKLYNTIHKLNLIQTGVSILGVLLFMGWMFKNLTEKKTEKKQKKKKKL